ncbi:MAG: hypothetical protein ACYDER_16405 [Ktedonobacteraceae bacterium]
MREPHPFTHDTRTRPTIATINWQHPLERINLGGHSVIYRPAPGIVAKIGLVEPEEAEAQQHMAQLGKALPVLDYHPLVRVAGQISRDMCSEHGVRPVMPDTCSCGYAQSVLLMPEAARPIGVDERVLETFMQEMRRVCKRELGLDWTITPRNVGVYKRRLVGLDFGIPEPEYG